MMIAFGARVKCSPLFFLLALFACVTGNIVPFLTHLLALLLHETAHVVMASMLGCHIDLLEVFPYGCGMTVSGMVSWSDEMLIALAGPVFSLLTFIGCRGQSGFICEFSLANAYIAAVNLLPAMPLDGGRVAYALLKLFEIKPDHCIAKVISLTLSAAVGAAGVFSKNITLIIFAVFMAGSWIGRKNDGEGAAQNHIRRLRMAAEGRGIEVRHVAISRNATASMALLYANGSKYTVYCVLDEDMREIGRIDYAALMHASAQTGSDKKLQDILRYIDPSEH